MESVCSFLKTETVNLQQIYFRDYKYAKKAPIAATWSKPLKAGGAPHHGSCCAAVCAPVFLMEKGSLIPQVTQTSSFMVKLDTTPIDGVIGLCHMVHGCFQRLTPSCCDRHLFGIFIALMMVIVVSEIYLL